jgi:hypothetical protein
MPTVAAVSDEDIRRKYYEAAQPTMWITELGLDPLHLIVCDDSSGKYYRVPVTLDGGDFAFGDPAEVAVRYIEASTAAEHEPAIVWASAAESRQGVAPPDPPTGPPPTTRPEPTGRGGSMSAAEAMRRVHAAAVAGTQTPATTNGSGSTTTTKEARVPEYDATKLTEALQVSPDASPEEKMAAFLNALPTLVGTVAGDGADQPQPQGTPALSAPTTTTAPVVDGSPMPAELAALAAKTNAVLIDRDQLAEMRKQAALGAEAHAEMKRNKRDETIKAALDARKIAPSSEQHWRTYWDSDPDGCKKALDALQPNLIPETLAGYIGTEAANKTDRDYLALFPEG